MSSGILREHMILYALLTALTAISIDALLPGLRQIGMEVSVVLPLSTQHIVSLFIFGMVFGELVLGPVSDAIGRKRALVLGLECPDFRVALPVASNIFRVHVVLVLC